MAGPQTETAPWAAPAEGEAPWGPEHPQQVAPTQTLAKTPFQIGAHTPTLMEEAGTFARTHGPGTGKTWADVGHDALKYGGMLAAGMSLPAASELDPIAPILGRVVKTAGRTLGDVSLYHPLRSVLGSPEAESSLMRAWRSTSPEGEALRSARMAEKSLMPGEKAAAAEDVRRAATGATSGAGGTSAPKARLVLTPEEAAAQEQMQRIATQRASERGMQYAGGMKPAPGKISMGPGAASPAEFAVPATEETDLDVALRRPLMHNDVAPVNMIPGSERATSVIPREELMQAGKYGSTEAGRAFDAKLRAIQDAHPEWSFDKQLAEAQK